MKQTVVAILLCLVTMSVSAQMRFGVKAGANMTDFSTQSSLVDQVKGATNYQFGVLLQAKTFGLALQPEVLYSVKSGTFNNSSVSGILSGTDQEFRSQNIEIPVNVQLGLDLIIARMYLQAGPYVSFMTGALLNDSKDDYEAIKEYVNTFDYGIGIGGGLEILHLQLAVKYDWGLSPMGKESILAGNNINPFNDLKNRNFSLSLAYLF